jgi:hypothetical protein
MLATPKKMIISYHVTETSFLDETYTDAIAYHHHSILFDDLHGWQQGRLRLGA